MMILLAEQAATVASHSHNHQAGSAHSLDAAISQQQRHMESQQNQQTHHRQQFKQQPPQQSQSHFNLAPSASSEAEPLSLQPPTTIAATQNQLPQQHYLTIEELKLALNSCWLCGCNWQADHVSLDCPECGGYALSRPCPTCDGRCKQTWSRNIKDTHDRHKAAWSGQCDIVQTHDPRMLGKQNCFEMGGIQIRSSNSRSIISGLNKPDTAANNTTSNASSSSLSPRMATTSTNTTAANLKLPASSSSCCSSHPSSAASSDSEESYDEMLIINKR